MKITFEQLEAIKKAATEKRLDNANPADRLTMRTLIMSTFNPTDYIETADERARKLALGLALFCYDREGKGYNGIKTEILFRAHSLKRLTVRNWFKHIANDNDATYNHRKAEIKSGCGAWLYSRNSDLDAIRAEYEATGDYIVWDYDHEPVPGRKNDNPICIHIACTWKTFFRYLDNYDGGWKTFFKYNASKSGQGQLHVYEMNTLRTSRKKIQFLENFDL